MNVLSSVRNKVIIILISMAVVQAVYLVTYLFNKEREAIKKTVYDKIENINISMQSSIGFLVRTNNTDQVKVKISELGIDSGIKYVFLINKNKIINASTKLSNIGKDVGELSLGFKANDVEKFERNLNESIVKSAARIWETGDQESVISVFPVSAFIEATSVRPERTGSLIIVHDLKKSADESYGLLIRLAFLQVMGLAIFGFILYFLVFRRIAIIRKSSEKISSGDFDISIPLTGNDEFSSLAKNIEKMAVQVNLLIGKLVRSEETFSKAQAIAHIGSWDWDIENGELSWSDEIYRIFGLKPQEFGATYDAFLNSVYPEDVDKVTSAVTASVADPEVKYVVEHRVIQPDSKIRDVREQGKVYRNEEGKPVRMIGTVLDITERKLIDQALTDERNFINTVLETVGALVVVLDVDGRIVRFNKACENLSGYNFDEIRNKYPWDTVIPKDDAREVRENAFKTLIKAPEKLTGTYTNYWVSKNGEYSLIEWSNNILFDSDGKVEFVVATGIDITEKNMAIEELKQYQDKLEHLVHDRTQELKDAQDELIRKERLATLGQLTATVSHELRNPLGAMSPSIYVIKKISDPDDERLQQAISRIERNIERCDRIIDELLDYTRIEMLSFEEININKWLNSTLDEQQIPDGITIVRNLMKEDGKVKIDSNVLRRAVINVYDNACHSMQDETKGNDSLPGSVLKVSTDIREGKVNIVFKDNGCGMDNETLNKIFEPLYSTKGFGVGLGMPTVLQVMERHNGGVEVKSEVDMGTEVTLWIPLSV